ncbi:leucine-rich repeat domain-containing protein [Blautia sp. MSK.20.9]|uniref:leucine-rich repeat domain-containing protein n=1 Tax=Blautia sp. MSK20_18 TaxID=2883186 RepID=UPI001570F1A3|nr:leucine-rich repeat domain-containing protein [Blautia sp. MSK20_18]MCB7508808.1 leucine-rich repeat domain-containing protein [Blautia sp. MSK20_18]NSK12487.1 leucine-rich repeat domain-containing protein [Blautia sp. MSK.20.9]
MIKEFKDNGCRFMCKCIPGSVSVFDMDVDDGVEVVEFEGFDDVSIGKVAEKSFPSVTTLVIGEEVDCISIPNKMFPNVRNIISYNRHFLNSDMLIRVDYNIFPNKNGKHTDIWLLNTFCKKPDEVINLKSVEFIDDYAFDGCSSTKIINEDCVKGGCQFAFWGSAFMELKPFGGAYMAGSMIIGVDEDVKELVIPEIATYFLNNRHDVTFLRKLCKSYDKIIVKNSSLFFKRVLYAYAAPKNLVIDCEVNEDKEDFCIYIKNCSNLQNIQITDKSERYMTYDGVLYDKAGKTLLACPKNRHGAVKIKEGTKEIEKNAFFDSKVEEIEMPDSVKSLEKAVFFNCRKLQKVKLSNSLTEIPDSCFDSNISLREIVIPDSVRTIGPYAFCSSGLENIHLGKHVKVIQHDALMDTKLKELRFPASVKELQDIGPLHASDVYLESSNIPSYFCSSVSETITFACDFDTLHKADSLAQPYVKVHTPKRTVYFPSHILIDTSNELSNFIEARNDFPENMFPYAIDTRIRFQIALAECRDLKSITAEKYLRKNIVDCVREFINIDEESALVDLFRMHLVDDVEALTEILQILPNSMVLAKAYLLNESEKLKLDDLSC